MLNYFFGIVPPKVFLLLMCSFLAFSLNCLFSPSSLTSKKSSELLMGGLNSLKFAATSVAKKFDEIKEAVSANNTPTKATNA